MSRPPFPPFTAETAAQKARMAEDAWNTRDPARVALAYTTDSRWRNRAEFLEGRAAIEAFLTRKWNRELNYRLIKEVWTFRDNRIAVRFAYEWHDDSGHWFRSYGNENWEFDEQGLMRLRIASINDLPIDEGERSITGRSAAAPTITRRSASSGYSGDENGPSYFPAHGKCIEHDSQILNAVSLIKIEDQDNIVLELRAIGAPPFIKEKHRRRCRIVRAMEDRLDRQLVGRRLRKQGKKAGGRLSSKDRVDDHGIVGKAGDHLTVVMLLDGPEIALDRGLS